MFKFWVKVRFLANHIAQIAALRQNFDWSIFKNFNPVFPLVPNVFNKYNTVVPLLKDTL